ncbi:NUDIX domain-containing protein [Paenibacillus glycanilyticus]|uniref:NUDIX domain-containing protein n=1 Tax=Paenibacillus glycanilyticus TaxID=126569 RepID=UPI003EBF1EFD
MYIQKLINRVPDLPLIMVRPTLILLNEDGLILFVKHCDGTWGLPGGLLEPGESVEEALKRELHEELNIYIDDLNHFKVFSGNGFSHRGRSGVEIHYIALTYISSNFEGVIKIDNHEVIEYGFFRSNEIPTDTLDMIKIIIKEYDNLH